MGRPPMLNLTGSHTNAERRRYLAKLEGVSASAVGDFAPACRRACEDDLDEYVARLAVGRCEAHPFLEVIST